MRRLDNGAPLRAAMAEAGLSVRALAAATKEIDPSGTGVSPAMVGRIRAEGTSGRDVMSDESAALIAAALRKPVHLLFGHDVPPMPTVSTVSAKQRARDTARTGGIELMLSAAELSQVIKKHTDWIYDQVKEHPAGSATPCPVHYAGKSFRFFLSEYIPWMDEVGRLAAAA